MAVTSGSVVAVVLGWSGESFVMAIDIFWLYALYGSPNGDDSCGSCPVAALCGHLTE